MHSVFGSFLMLDPQAARVYFVLKQPAMIDSKLLINYTVSIVNHNVLLLPEQSTETGKVISSTGQLCLSLEKLLRVWKVMDGRPSLCLSVRISDSLSMREM